ncbi:diacylglycerol O-acyltransferase [Achlya hypogyna]|uniref:Diacylglycerol O-acyltransferase n=1 Tax=Achlya hypogyna TaxID=1202772 RepID=A0A1V9Z8M0_ACHHY|nr:diacylglycerol O-acyltransferase [Achlya hypogyna]
MKLATERSPTSWRTVAVCLVVADFTAFLLRVSTDVYHYAVMALVHPWLHDAATFVLFFAVPLTHVLLLSVAADGDGCSGTFRAYHVASWVIYAIALCGSLAASLELPSPIRSISATCLCFIAEMFMVSAILVLEKTQSGLAKAPLFVHNYIHLLAIVGASFLALVADAQTDAVASDASLGSLLLCIAAVTSTYGLGGILNNEAHGWRFFQPFRGGGRFVRMQFVAWTTFSVSLLLQTLFLLSFLIIELEVVVGLMGYAAASALFSQISMMVSLRFYQPPPKAPRETALLDLATTALFCNLPLFGYLPFVIAFAFADLTWAAVAAYSSVYIIGTTLMAIALPSMVAFYERHAHRSPWYHPKFWICPLLFYVLPAASTVYHYMHALPAARATAVVAAAWYLYYIGTMVGMPAQTGCRMRRRIIGTGSPLVEAVARYFSATVIRTAPLDPAATYVFGFHPHGITPLTVMWLQLCAAWRAVFPNVFAVPLTASVVHYVPLLRDGLQFFGAREVTRRTFEASLAAKQSVMVVPGGQAEMLHSRSGERQIRVFTGHKGFLRLALEHGAPLVPVLSFQEGEVLDNVQMPALQQWTVKKFAVPCPFFPYGTFYLPIPRRLPMTVAVGAPIPVPHIAKPSVDDVHRLHGVYFGALRTLFETHKAQAGCDGFELVYIDE